MKIKKRGLSIGLLTAKHSPGYIKYVWKTIEREIKTVAVSLKEVKTPKRIDSSRWYTMSKKDWFLYSIKYNHNWDTNKYSSNQYIVPGDLVRTIGDCTLLIRPETKKTIKGIYENNKSYEERK